MKLSYLKQLAESKDVKKRTLEYKAFCGTCFMTGKACVCQGDIVGKKPYAYDGFAFMLMPFNSTLDEVYRAQLEPCIKSVMKEVKRADDIAKTGYVICEKICKQIQLADLVCAEISCDNPNVFYELGLAYALDRSVVLFVKKKVDREDVIRKMGLSESEYNIYYPFDLLKKEDVKLWRIAAKEKRAVSRDDKTVIVLADSRRFAECINGQMMSYSIDDLCRGAINKTLDTLGIGDLSLDFKNRKTITFSSGDVSGYFEDQDTGEKKKEAISFEDVENYIRDAACVIICTHDSEPLSYFWLGFSHGLQKDVIPITVSLEGADTSGLDVNNLDELKNVCGDNRLKYGYYNNIEISDLQNISKERRDRKRDVDYKSEPTLPFDIRALWHISFHYNRPTDLHEQLKEVLKILIHRYKDKQYRRLFWRQFIEQDKVSVYVGSIEHETSDKSNKSHVVGEWDYRAVSELTAFLSTIKETIKVVIQTPIFKIKREELKDSEIRAKYVEELKGKLEKGNSIILGTSDVNDITEVALGYLHHNQLLFEPDRNQDQTFNGVVAMKSANEGNERIGSTFCKFNQQDKEKTPYRGFIEYVGGVEKKKWVENYYTYYNICNGVGLKTESRVYNKYLAYVAKIKINKEHWAIVLQGVTGPATLGLVQALTGCVNKQFSVFNKENEHAELGEGVNRKQKSTKQKEGNIQYELLKKIAESEKIVKLKEVFSDFESTKKHFIENMDEIVNVSINSSEKMFARKMLELKRKNVTSKIFHEQSESMTKMLEDIFVAKGSVEAIIKVYTTVGVDAGHDERLIIWWEFHEPPREVLI